MQATEEDIPTQGFAGWVHAQQELDETPEPNPKPPVSEAGEKFAWIVLAATFPLWTMAFMMAVPPFTARLLWAKCPWRKQ